MMDTNTPAHSLLHAAGEQGSTGLLLVGHGTRNRDGRAEFFQTAAGVRQRCEAVPVEACFLELAAPTIAEGVERLAARGARRLVVVPLVLFAARHAKRDIPEAVASAAARYPGVATVQSPPIGGHAGVLQLSVQRYVEAIEGQEPVPDCETGLLLVGRGTSDELAVAQMQQWAAGRAAERPVGWAGPCFLDVARPSLAEMLDQVSHRPLRRVVVQPHILYQGELLAGLRLQVETAASRWQHLQWLVTGHLGPAEPVTRAVMELAAAACVRF